MKIPRNDHKLVFEQQIKFIKKSCDDFDNGDESEAIRIAGHLRTLLHDSIQKKDFDSKLSNMVTELGDLLADNEFSDKRKVLVKLKSIEHKIEQQKKKQVSSKSLLTQMNIKNQIMFLDTAIPPGSFSFWTFKKGLSNTSVFLRSYFGLLAKEVDEVDGSQQVKYLPLCLSGNNPAAYFKECNSVSFEEWWNKIIYNNGGVQFTRKTLITAVANLDGYAHVDENMDPKYQSFKESNILEDFINGYKKEKINLATLNSTRQIAYELLISIGDV